MLVKNSFLKNVATVVACFAVCAVMSCASCGGNKDKDGNGGSNKLSPPAWIHGSWGESGITLYRFTADDFMIGGISFKSMHPATSTFGSYSFRETKTDALYEVRLTVKAVTGESAAGTYSFKKGDGTYIEAAAAEEGDVIEQSDYVRLSKL